MVGASVAGASPFHAAKLSVAAFFGQRILPQVYGLAASIAAGGQSISDLPADAF
jgi:hypothetical protein